MGFSSRFFLFFIGVYRRHRQLTGSLVDPFFSALQEIEWVILRRFRLLSGGAENGACRIV